MNHSMRWSGVDAQSRPASDWNEDAFGFTTQRLWVLDGATGISDVKCTAHASDAAWLAECISDQLKKIADQPLSTLLPQLERQVTQAFAQALQSGVNLRDVDMPCACLGLVQAWQEHIEIACVGDITVVVQTPDGCLSIFTDQEAAPFSEKTTAHWQHLLKEHGSPAAAWPFLRPLIRHNRAAVNRAGGYTVIHPARPWVHRTQMHRLPMQPGMRVLLASDGAWRLVDLFAQYTASSLLDHVTRHQWAAALDQLHALELADADCQQYLRVKPHDDATGLLATWLGESA